MATPANRILIGKTSNLWTRKRIYLSADSIEVDEIDSFYITRKRVFLDEVLLVTYHRFIRKGLSISAMAIAALFLFIGLSTRDEEAIIFFAILAGLIIIPVMVHLVYRIDGVTVYGKRCKAELFFRFRKKRARYLFDAICQQVQKRQAEIAAEVEKNSAPESY